ncbi:MAG: hypothetical protein JW987_10875 [Anaerolineaceae bacterium]|nr:hypothetical protein [Anaerolineaceae bacterium]
MRMLLDDGSSRPPALHVQLLGGFGVWVNGEPLSEEQLHSRRVRNLIKLLALTPGHRLHRDKIIDTLWPDSDLDAATNNFHQTLHTTRKVLCPDGLRCLLLDEGWLHLDGLDVDIERFEAAASILRNDPSLENYQAALDLYTGDLLPDDPYEEWIGPRREAVKETYQRLLMGLAEAHERCQEYPAGIAALRKLLEMDPCSEEAHAGLMRLLAKSGQRRAALRQYETFKERLRQELDAEPSQSTQELYQMVHSGRLSPKLVVAIPRHNLPAETTSFIGRDHEIARLKQTILSRKTRLVTVSGAGGVGKTRLALRTAEELLEAFKNRVRFVDLARLTDPDLVAVTTLKVLGLKEVPGQSPSELLVDFLHDKRYLIVLDNCEHVIQAAAELTETLLRGCPRVVVLATSRELLNINGEMIFRCPSLRLPKRRQSVNENFFAEPAAECEAVRLFSERAAQADTKFLLNERSLPPVLEVCRRLDGIPLAIEMAAARLRVLPVEQIAGRLDHVFQTLKGGLRTELPRHQTLKAVIDWSYDLLSEAEQVLLRRLGVFVGGWTLDAAEAICVDGEKLQSTDILDLLGQLVDKLLVLYEQVGEQDSRFRMLEPVRQYALERLLEREGETGLRQRHLEYFCALAEEAEPHLHAWGMVEWLARLEQELGNIRSALAWSLSDSVEPGVRMGSALLWFWTIHGHTSEAVDWLERLLAVEEKKYATIERTKEDWIARARLLFAAGRLRISEISFGGPRYPTIQAAKQIFLKYREEHDPEITACTYGGFETWEEAVDRLETCLRKGYLFYAGEYLKDFMREHMFKGELDQAQSFGEKNLSIRRQIGDVDGEGWALHNLSELAVRRGNYPDFVNYAHAAQACFELVGNRGQALFAAIIPVRVMVYEGNYEQARQFALEMNTVSREMGELHAQYLAHIWLAQSCCFLGLYDEAEASYEWIEQNMAESNFIPYLIARICLSRGDWVRAAGYLRSEKINMNAFRLLAIRMLGVVNVLEKRERRAAVMFGALDRWAGWLNVASSPAERDEYERVLASAREALGEEAFQAAWETGRAMTREEMYAYAKES